MLFKSSRISAFILGLLFIAFVLGGCDNSSDQSTPSRTENKTRDIGIATFVDHVVLNTIRDGFMAKLTSLGYTRKQGWNVTVLNANGSNAEAAAIANELINLKPAVLVSFSTPATKPLFEKNNGRYPLVFSFVSFPESIGIHPKSPNVTGLSDGVDFKLLLNLVRDIVPGARRIGMVASDEPNAQVSYEQLKMLTKVEGIAFSTQIVSKEEEVRGAIEALTQQPLERRPQAILVGADGVVTNKITALIDVTSSAGIPVFAVDEGSVEKGAVAGLSVNYTDFGKETAKVTARILEGEQPSDIPMNRYVAKDILVNTRAAQSIDLTIPKAVMERAVRVIKQIGSAADVNNRIY